MKDEQQELTEEVARLKKEQSKQQGLVRRMSKLEIVVKERDDLIKMKDETIKLEKQDARMATNSARKELGDLKKRVSTLERELKSKEDTLKKMKEKETKTPENNKAESESHFCLTQKELSLFHSQTLAFPEQTQVTTARSERIQSKRKKAFERSKDQETMQLKSEIKALKDLIIKIKPDIDYDDIVSQAPSLSTFRPRKLFGSQEELNQISTLQVQPSENQNMKTTISEAMVTSYEQNESSDEFSLSHVRRPQTQIYYFRPKCKPIRKRPRSFVEKMKAKMEDHESLTIIGSCLTGAGLISSLYLIWKKLIK